jgi:transglutaminase-like putative cysteine protease
MTIDIKAQFAFRLDAPTDALLQFEAAAIPEQRIASCDTQVSECEHLARVPAQDAIGERMWLRATGEIHIDYTVGVDVQRVLPDLSGLAQMDLHDLPGETVPYLLDSRYVHAGRFQNFTQEQFSDLSGGAMIAAMRDWIYDSLTYTAGSSTAETTAADTFIAREGVCRDYAHVMVSLARAAGIPARFVSCYDPGVDPQDFHAVAEVFLADPDHEGGIWHLVDATKMADPASIVKIGVGRDAADVSFLTTFGWSEMIEQQVSVSQG